MADGIEPEVIDAASVAAPNLHPVTESVVAQTGERPAAPVNERFSHETIRSSENVSPAGPANLMDAKGRPRTDRNGDAFDPDRHQVDASGLAVLRSDGRLMLKPDARRKGAAASGASRLPPSASPAASPPPAGSPGAPPVVEAPPVDYRDVARGLVVPALGLVTVALGPDEWAFEKVETGQYLDVTEQLCRKYNVTGGVPPEVQLAMLAVSSVAARASKPCTGAWLVRAKAWGVAWLVRLGWSKRKPQPEPEKKPDDKAPDETAPQS